MTLADLDAKLEQAKEGSRELDGEIAKEVGWTFMEKWILQNDHWLNPNGDPDELPYFTSSLDTALTFARNRGEAASMIGAALNAINSPHCDWDAPVAMWPGIQAMLIFAFKTMGEDR